MKKHSLLLLLTCFSVSIVALLYVSFDEIKLTHHPFERTLLPSFVKEINSLTLENNKFYLSGSTNDHIYLANHADPTKITYSNFALSGINHLQLANKEQFEFNVSFLTIDSPNFYISDFSSSKHYYGSFSDNIIKPSVQKRMMLVDAVPINKQSLAVRTWKKDSIQELELAKLTSVPLNIERASTLLQKQVDGIFCTDGKLIYNRDLDRLVYVYFYRNEFICMDTTMSLIFRGNTLDTVNRVNLRPAEVKSENQFTTLSRPLTTNPRSYTSGQWLFVQSGLLAKNEDEETFQNNSVIDVYDLTQKGEYTFSFYLPDYNGFKVKQFNVTGNLIAVIYDRYLVTYSITPDLLHAKKYLLRDKIRSKPKT
ncbi:hypothetical protein FNH22_03765 [Fulvivirga sp. M361]|uniref:hypothetical protein n=1 Tax=Fulvivirga sp. M361 TaxID=2594266 RepID=UPI001179B8B8|nr:hypothetical protein [Fulvivirga sp. M361]TRX61182.1 hypothetical protein FNH22_03765 [Fulvivirga sp. M361]